MISRSDTTTIFRSAGGAALAADVIGDGPPVLLLHGVGQTRGSWLKTARRLADIGYRAITLDARGHGGSDWSVEGYGLDLFANDLAAVVASVGGTPAVVGASMGGLTALYAAGRSDPVPLSALLLVDIAMRPNAAGRDRIMAFMNAHPDGFATVEEAAAAVSAYLPQRTRPKGTAGLQRNLRERHGRFYWHWDPTLIETDRWPSVEMQAAARRVRIPTLLIRGGDSEMVDAAAVADMRAWLPDIEITVVDGAGHMVAGDANTPFADSVVAFLQQHYPA